MDKATFIVKYNDGSTGLFKNNSAKEITAARARTLVDDLGGNVPFTDDDSYSWAFPGITTAGGTTAYTGTLAPAITGYSNRMKVQIKVNATSTGASTLNLNTVAVKKIFVSPTVQAGAGDLLINQTYVLVYDTSLDGGAGGWLIIGHPRGGSSVVPVLFGGDWNFPAGAFPVSVKSGTIYIATADHGAPGDGDYVQAGQRMLSTIDGADAFNEYSIW